MYNFLCQVLLCRRFQITIFRTLLDHSLRKLEEVLGRFSLGQYLGIDYPLLPQARIQRRPLVFDWECAVSMLFPYEEHSKEHIDFSLSDNCSHVLHTKNGIVCTCMIRNSLVCTPHNGLLYSITSLFDNLNGNSLRKLRDGQVLTNKSYYATRYFLLLHTSCIGILIFAY